jgi:ABC-2 type transport system permease protein
LGVMIHYSLMLLLAAVCFWTVKAQGIVWGYYNLFNIARMPDDAFRGVFKVFFTLAIPMLLVSNVPTRVLADKVTSPHSVILMLILAVVCWVVSVFGWRASLRRYTSASS